MEMDPRPLAFYHDLKALTGLNEPKAQMEDSNYIDSQVD